MTRLLLSSIAAAVLLAAPLAATAATTTKPVKHMAAKHSMAKPVSAKAKPMPRRDPGSAAVDALNDQALARAKAGQ